MKPLCKLFVARPSLHYYYVGFWQIFGGLERVKNVLQFYNKTLPATLITDERKLVCGKKCFRLRL